MKPKSRPESGDPLVSELKDIGQRSAQWLTHVGILRSTDLAHIGPIIAYRIVKEAGFPVSLNLLYAMEAALRGIHWLALPPQEKRCLREEVGL